MNAILRYLERAKKIEIDLDGNIIWMSSEKNSQSNLVDKAVFSPDFIGHLKSRNINLSSNENI